MQNISKANIKEIFTSIQGEGPYVGQKHIFVRFCRCNLKCNFCDTDFDINNSKEYNIDELYEEIKNIDCEVISFTGGEPLLEIEFLCDFLKKYKNKLNKKIYLETNGTLYQNLVRILDFVDIISMDIKLQSATGQVKRLFENEKFINLSRQKKLFVKVVFDKNIKDEEIIEVSNLVKKYDRPLVLQPKMPLDEDIKLNEIFDKFYSIYKNTRLICQTHKFLNLQ